MLDAQGGNLVSSSGAPAESRGPVKALLLPAHDSMFRPPLFPEPKSVTDGFVAIPGHCDEAGPRVLGSCTQPRAGSCSSSSSMSTTRFQHPNLAHDIKEHVKYKYLFLLLLKNKTTIKYCSVKKIFAVLIKT